MGVDVGQLPVKQGGTMDEGRRGAEMGPLVARKGVRWNVLVFAGGL